MPFVTFPILSNFPTNISFFTDYSTHDYYTTSSETSETSTLEDKEVEEKAEDLTAPEIEEFLQQTPYVQQQSGYIQQPQQSGSFYTGRVGLPTPVFNLDVRRKQPGPRFRNEMLLPKRFRGKTKYF